MVQPKRSAIVAAFAAVYLVWGSTYLAIRFTIETLPPLFSAGVRFFIAGLILYAFARWIKKEAAPSWVHWRSAFIIGGFLLVGGNGSVVWAERYVPSGLASLIIATTPLWMVLVQWLWAKGKRPGLAEFVGIALGFLGVWLLIAPDLVHVSSANIHLKGGLVLVLAAILWSIGSVYARRAPLPRGPLLATGMEMIGGGVLLMLLGLGQNELSGFQAAQISLKSLLSFVYLIVFGSLVGFSSYIWLLNNVGVARASTYAFVNPLVAVFLGWALAGEKLSPQIGFAAALVILAVAVITLNHRKAED